MSQEEDIAVYVIYCQSVVIWDSTPQHASFLTSAILASFVYYTFFSCGFQHLMLTHEYFCVN